METVADGVRRISVRGAHLVNTYLVGDVIVDAGTSRSPDKALLRVLDELPVNAHALTHAHPDHAGGSHRVSEALSLPVWAPAGDADVIESGRLAEGARLFRAFGGFEGVPVSRRLKEGDDLIDGFVVIDTPGHTAGHISFWREADRVLIVGDIFTNVSPLTHRVGLRHPSRLFTPDVEENRRSQRKLAALEPDVVAFGHGPVLRNAAPVLDAWVKRQS